MRPSSKFVWTSYLMAFALLHAPAHARGAQPTGSAALTCDADMLHADSYAVALHAQADTSPGSAAE